MEERQSGGLGAWILGPIVLLPVLIFSMQLLPPVDCGVGSNGPSSGREAFAVIAGACVALIAVAGIVRLVAMWREGSYVARDGWIGGLTVLAPAIGASATSGNRGGLPGALAVGGVVMLLSFLALLVAVGLKKDLRDVGVLVPTYLLGAACTFVLVAWVILDLNAGAIC
jgi:hypothetical protein